MATEIILDIRDIERKQKEHDNEINKLIITVDYLQRQIRTIERYLNKRDQSSNQARNMFSGMWGG